MKVSFLYCSILAVIIPLCASADTQWCKLGLSGGNVSDLASFPGDPKIMLACVAGHGIYRSIDRGDSWSPVANGSWNDVSVSEEGVAFLAGDSGVMVSYDRGTIWKTCLDEAAWRVVAFRDGIVAVGSGVYAEYMYKYPAWRLSRDNGEVWETWTGTENTLSLLFHESGVVYRSGDYSIYRCKPDNWSLWSLAFGPNYFGPDLRFGFADGDSVLFGYSRYVDLHPIGAMWGGVFRSADSGMTWKQFTNVSSVSALERSEDTIFIGTPEGSLVRASIAAAETDTIGAFGGEITAIDAKGFGSGELLVATKGGIYKTDDGGLHWRKSDSGIMHPEIASVQVTPSRSGGERIVAAAKDGGIFFSDDTGGHWTWADPDVHTLPGLLKVSESDPQRIYAAEASIHVSRNGGETWERIERIPLWFYYGWYGRTTDIEIDPLDADRITVNYYNHSLDDIKGIFYGDGRFTEKNDNTWGGWEWKTPFDSGQQFRSQFSKDGTLTWISASGYDTGPVLAAYDDTGECVRRIVLPGSSGYHYWLIDNQFCYVLSEPEKRFWISPDLGETWDFVDPGLNDYALNHRAYPNSDEKHGESLFHRTGRRCICSIRATVYSRATIMAGHGMR